MNEGLGDGVVVRVTLTDEDVRVVLCETELGMLGEFELDLEEDAASDTVALFEATLGLPVTEADDASCGDMEHEADTLNDTD